MAVQTTYTKARANLARLLDLVTQDRETVIIERRRAGRVALIAAEEISSLLETAHLLRSPKNAQRALNYKPQPMTVEDMRREVGLDRQKR